MHFLILFLSLLNKCGSFFSKRFTYHISSDVKERNGLKWFISNCSTVWVQNR